MSATVADWDADFLAYFRQLLPKVPLIRATSRLHPPHLKQSLKRLPPLMWLACRTQQEIAEAVGLEKMQVSRIFDNSNILEKFPKGYNCSDFDDGLDNDFSGCALSPLHSETGTRAWRDLAAVKA